MVPDGDQPAWEWGLSLVGYGRGERVLAVETARLSPDENRIEYDRGPVSEWYVNGPRGLKQGFTLAGPPELLEGAALPGSRVAEQDPAFLVLAIDGALRSWTKRPGPMGSEGPVSDPLLRGLNVCRLRLDVQGQPTDAHDAGVAPGFDGVSAVRESCSPKFSS